MLVLSRKLGEQVMIGDNVCVTVVAIRGHRVRLGVSAPEEVSIRREEVPRSPKNQTMPRRQPDSCAVIAAPETQP